MSPNDTVYYIADWAESEESKFVNRGKVVKINTTRQRPILIEDSHGKLRISEEEVRTVISSGNKGAIKQ